MDFLILKNLKKKDNNIAINVFGYNEEESLFRYYGPQSGKNGKKKCEIFPLRVSDFKGKEPTNTHVNILLMSNENGDKHYVLIKNTSRLFSSQINKHKEKIQICNYCLQHFSKETLKNHLEFCSKHKCGKTAYPSPGEKSKFKNYEKMHNVPFVIYADFECNLKYEDKNIGDNTKQFQKHKPSGYCYLIKCFDNNLYKPKLVRCTKKFKDEDISIKFVKSLENNDKKIHEQFKFPKRMIFREKDKEDFEKADKCYACAKVFQNGLQSDEKNNQGTKSNKVRDHCHYSGKYRGAVCKSCNSKMKKPKFIPVIFHNLQNYDSHLFIKNLGITEVEINSIPKTEEKYISFTKEFIVDKFKTEKIITEK